MLVMGRKKKDAEPASSAASEKRRRNVIFITLDDVLEQALQRFLSKQRVQPDRSAIGLTALIEFLQREGCMDPPKKA